MRRRLTGNRRQGARACPLCYKVPQSLQEDNTMAEPEREELTMHVVVEAKSRSVLRVNHEPQSPAPALDEFLRGKQREGWAVKGTAPSGAHLLIVLKRPLP